MMQCSLLSFKWVDYKLVNILFEYFTLMVEKTCIFHLYIQVQVTSCVINVKKDILSVSRKAFTAFTACT